VKHHTNARFWKCYRGLPKQIRELADRNYELLKSDPAHRSLHFKKIGEVWSVRVGLQHRALATEAQNAFVWFWIGSHAEYDKLLGRKPATRTVRPPTDSARKGRSKRRGPGSR
jgi:hypothetical protein